MKVTDRKFYCPQNPYEDSPQSIGHGATISAPHMHGYALEYLQEALQPGVKVLDVGSGSGYLTACMAELVGPQGKVVGVEHIPELVTWSRQNVQRARPDYLEQDRILFVQGDGRLGYSPEAPYDVIHVGAASEGRPTQMLEQLKSPGKMFVPVEDSSHLGQSIILYSKTSDGKVTQHTLMGVAYVPLTDPEIQTGRGLYL
ncbi:hypothetical protein IWQ61_005843 [Dispira simplex]|nr:hypothetical protein IWQ61_005843 [Dispira simplex]